MKKILLIPIFLFAVLIAEAQTDLRITVNRVKSFSGSGLTLSIAINGADAFKIKNGASETITLKVDRTKPITITAKSGLAKKEINIENIKGEELVLNAALKGGFVTLEVVKGGTIAQGSGVTSGTSVDKNTLGVTYSYQNINSTDTLRQQWIDKGGKLMGISFTTAGTYTGMKMEGSSFNGKGLTFNMGATFLNFKPPVYKEGLLTWNSSIYGFMVTNQFMSTTTKIDIQGMDPEKFTMMNFNLLVSGNIGYTFGFGKFREETKWKGIALDLTYRPSAILTLSEAGGDGQINFLGFGVDVNFNNFASNASRLAPKAQSKITLFLLPPINDKPIFLTVGYGVTFYKKRS